MLQSVISRLAFFGAMAVLILAVPIFYFINADASPLDTNAAKLENLEPETSVASIGEAELAEEPVVKLASLTVGSAKPALEILELGPSETAASVELAAELAEEQRFDEALATLDAIHISNRDDYAVKFLEARILAWAGDHERSEQEFQKLRSHYPQDLDIMVSFGYLQFYQRNYAESEKTFAEVINLNPDYGDAQTGLERARRAQNMR